MAKSALPKPSQPLDATEPAADHSGDHAQVNIDESATSTGPEDQTLCLDPIAKCLQSLISAVQEIETEIDGLKRSLSKLRRDAANNLSRALAERNALIAAIKKSIPDFDPSTKAVIKGNRRLELLNQVRDIRLPRK